LPSPSRLSAERAELRELLGEAGADEEVAATERAERQVRGALSTLPPSLPLNAITLLHAVEAVLAD
jgi:hypothetical protein